MTNIETSKIQNVEGPFEDRIFSVEAKGPFHTGVECMNCGWFIAHTSLPRGKNGRSFVPHKCPHCRESRRVE